MNTKRYEIRKAKKTDMELISSYWDDTVSLMATDISPEGAFVATDLPLEQGEHVVISFKLDDPEKEYVIFAEVTRVCLNRRTTDKGLSGMGLKFLDAKPFERLSIREFVRKVPPPVPGASRNRFKRSEMGVPVVFS